MKPRFRVSAGRRSFKAARFDPAAPVWTRLSVQGGATGPEIIGRQLPALIARARDAARNVDHVVAFERMVRRHVVGPRGVRLNSLAVTRAGDDDQEARDLVEALFAEWSAKGACTICGGLSLRGVQQMAATMRAREGNFFCLTHLGRRFGRFGIALEPVPIDELALHVTRREPGRARIENGIEFDPAGRPVAYHFRRAETRGRVRTIRVPADQVLHVFDAWEPRQHLGVPVSHAAVRRLAQLEMLEEAQVKAAHFGAEKLAFIEGGTDFGDDPVVDDGGGARGRAGGEDGEGEGYDRGSEWDIEEGAGKVIELPDGKQIKALDFSFPRTDPAPFARHFLRGAAASLGVSYAGLTGDLENANYSSLRDGRGEERDEWRILQNDLIEDFLDPLYDRWRRAIYLAGLFGDAVEDFERIRPRSWRARGWQAVNQKEEAAANEADLRLGLTTEREIVEQRGGDYDELLRRMARDRAAREALLGDAAAEPN